MFGFKSPLVKTFLDLGKFIMLVVIPITAWALSLKADIEKTNLKLEAAVTRIDKQDQVTRDISEIKEALGEIRGELKRIGR